MLRETANSQNLHAISNRFSPIHLNDMEKVSLMDRIDTKFIFHRRQLQKIMERASSHYQILEIGEKRLMTYKNQYFDTLGRQFFLDHHNGKGNRTKVRIREYTDSNLHFLEVKQKSNKGRTIKKRKSITDISATLSQESKEFINLQLKARTSLSPSLWNSFQRMTLVNIRTQERATFDTDLSFKIDQNQHGLQNLVIAELKQAIFNRSSPLFQILKSEAIYPYRISKYCIGLTSLNTDLKYNLFKEKILRINKITKD